MRGFLLAFVTAIVLSACVGLVYAAEETQRDSVSGTVSGTWTLAGSPYYVVNNINVPTDSTLIINPGVEVIFNGYYKLNVGSNATLQALGAEDDSVIFTSAVPGAIQWHGIRFNNASPACSLTYCVIEYGRANGFESDSCGGGIYCYNSDPYIAHSSIRFCSASNDGGGMYCLSSNPIVEYCVFIENVAANGGGIFLDDSNPAIQSCRIYNCSASNDGGGILCANNSSPTIDLTTISGNSADNGGGIHCIGSSNPFIMDCQISYCSALFMGGGICCLDNSTPQISDTKIVDGNLALWGGGIFIGDCNPDVDHCIISGNSANDGGGIYVDGYMPNVNHSTIRGNSAINGGGIYCTGFDPHITSNNISENYALCDGGGFYFWQCSLTDTLNKNTLYGNVAGGLGGGMYLFSSTIRVDNSICWGNIDSTGMVPFMQIRPGGAASSATVDYSDIQGGWPGTGNIVLYPAFVDTAWDDYRLQWGSPCIDLGDPNPFYNDPDATIADMGCYYFDQSNPVRILLTPHTTSHTLTIPSAGGSFDYTIRATNISLATQMTNVWIDVTKPNGSMFGPVFGPYWINIGSGVTLSYVGPQNVPAIAPTGRYWYTAYAVVGVNTSWDSFAFVKLGIPGLDELSGWTNSGGSFGTPAEILDEVNIPVVNLLYQNFPNPFNASTTISYQLSEVGHVNLTIYDVAGRKVAELVDGWRDEGLHEVTFDGLDIPSGVYFARLTTGDVQQMRKLLLVK